MYSHHSSMSNIFIRQPCFPKTKQMKMSSTIYLDHNATTPLDPEVALAMQPCLIDNCCFGNPTRAHWAGIPAKNAIQQAKLHVSHLINASTSEIVFTSGTTQAINLVAHSFGKRFINKDDEIIISNIEHHANTVPWQILCEERGAKLKVIPVSDDGELVMEEYEKLLSNKSLVNFLISINWL